MSRRLVDYVLFVLYREAGSRSDFAVKRRSIHIKHTLKSSNCSNDEGPVQQFLAQRHSRCVYVLFLNSFPPFAD